MELSCKKSIVKSEPLEIRTDLVGKRPVYFVNSNNQLNQSID